MSGDFVADSPILQTEEKKREQKKEQAKEKSFYAFNTFLISFVSFHTLMHKFRPV